MNEENSSSQKLSIAISVGALLLLVLTSPLALNNQVLYLAMQFVVVSIVIWQACDPFADAAQWIGIKLRIPGSVRGATLDAIASSIPELFTGIFFVVATMTASGQTAEVTAEGDGFGASLATCAGSAVYNMILIPAFCVLVISFQRLSRPTIDVEPEVISRDGMWFLGAEAVLILFMFQEQMHWWMGVVFLLLYAVYIFQLVRDARIYQRAIKLVEQHFGTIDENTSKESIFQTLQGQGFKTNPVLIDQILRARQSEEDDSTDTAGVLYGLFDIPLNGFSATMIILISTAIAGLSCYWLVELAHETAHKFEIPVFFVAVILVAAASSVPDTFLSIGAAKRR